MEKLQDSSRRAARWRAAIQILSLPLLGSATASNLFGQCTQENSRVEENICSEKRPIKLLFSSSQAKGPLLVLLLAQDFCVLLLRSHYFCKITLARGEKISVILMHYKKLLQYSRFFQRKKNHVNARTYCCFFVVPLWFWYTNHPHKNFTVY